MRREGGGRRVTDEKLEGDGFGTVVAARRAQRTAPEHTSKSRARQLGSSSESLCTSMPRPSRTTLAIASMGVDRGCRSGAIPEPEE